jgi:hypothetical protein
MEEESIMYSDDRTIELTTHRILEHTRDRTNQIMLKDFKNYEFKAYHIGNYKTIVIIFVVLTISTIILNLKLYYSEFAYTITGTTFWNYLWAGIMIKFCTFFLFLSLFFFIISRRFFVKLNGKYNSIEFRIGSPYNTSVKKFLNAIELQINIIKNVTH